MFWIRRRPLAALAAFAFALRVACAVATEINPIFPAYYYTDATRTHAYAMSALEDVRAGRRPLINGTLGERLQTSISLTVYRALGPRPFAIKLFNAMVGALAVAAFAWALSSVFALPAAAGAGLVLAVWPSHIFYTSQNLKEAPAGALAYAALGAALAGGFDPRGSRGRAAALALSAALALLGAGFYRSYVMVSMGAALLAALGLTALRPPRANAMLTIAALALALALYPSLSRGFLDSFHSIALSETDRNRTQSNLIPVTYDSGLGISRPTSPAGITRFRYVRQWADRNWAATTTHRDIGTQIYPDEKFRTWLDVLLYVPKGAFTVLFMPLPGLYPMDGKIGRLASAGENVLLLLLAGLGAIGAIRGPKTPARLGLLAFFAAMTVGAALLEFDLGSAGRHKLLYLPLLFPFAFEEIRRFSGPRETA